MIFNNRKEEYIELNLDDIFNENGYINNDDCEKYQQNI